MEKGLYTCKAEPKNGEDLMIDISDIHTSYRFVGRRHSRALGNLRARFERFKMIDEAEI